MGLFSKVKGPKERKSLVEVLAFLVTETVAARTPVKTPQAIAKSLLKYEPTLVAASGGDVTPDAMGNIGLFATSAGITAVQGGTAASAPSSDAAPSADAVEVPKFELQTGYAVPESRRGGGLQHKESIYPFKSMQVGQSFFVAATEAKPDPAKGLQSTVTSANKRFVTVFPATIGSGENAKPHPKAGQPTGLDARKFVVRPRKATDPGEKADGARVYRIA